MNNTKESIEVIELLEMLRNKDKELFTETKGYIKGLLRINLKNKNNGGEHNGKKYSRNSRNKATRHKGDKWNEIS